MTAAVDPRPDVRRYFLQRRRDVLFWGSVAGLGSIYLLLLVGMLLALATFTTPATMWERLLTPEIRYAVRLSLVSCTLSTLLALWIAVPLAYLMARAKFPGKVLVDAVLDIPMVLPPLVIGLGLLVLFQTSIGQWIQQAMPVTYHVPAVILAQLTVCGALAVRTLRVTFEQIDPRSEQVAWTLGCTRGQAFWRVLLPQAKRGIMTAATLVWARALGEFCPILVFAGATRLRTEVLPTSVYLELQRGNVEGAVAVSMIMIAVSALVLVLTRFWGLRETPK